jgi:hypothetical protein
MKDDFLYQFQKAPQRKFAASLYQRISKPMRTTSRTLSFRYVALALSLVVMIGAASFLSPTTRALADSIIRQFGVFAFVQAAPEPKAIQSSSNEQQTSDQPVQKDPSQDQADPSKHQSPSNENTTVIDVSDAAAASQLTGFTVLAPAYLPKGYQIENASAGWTVLQGNNEVRASIYYESPDKESSLTIEQLKHQPGESKTVESQEIVDVTVRGQSGAWMPDSPRNNMLVWEENGITYLIVSNRLPLEEVLKVAESLGK